MTDDGNSGDGAVHPLRFAGERKQPRRPEEIARRRPELASADRPAELEARAARRSVYVRSTAEAAKPDVEVSGVELTGAEAGGASGLWRVDIPVDPHEGEGALPGRTGERRDPDEFLSEIDPDVDFRGHRPEWVDSLPMPRTLPAGVSPMARLDRRRLLRPFQTTRFPPEERQIYQDASYPWGLVAKIFTSTGSTGSAALVGPRLAVTAGHMIPPSGSWWIRVVPAFFDGASLHGPGVESYVSDWRGFNPSPEVAGYDWVILRLYEPLGSWCGWFGFNGYDDDWEDKPLWTVLGYPGAIAGGQRPSWQSGVSVFDDDSDSNGGLELETRADMGPGNSGGPMYGWWGNDPRVVGVVSGEEYDWAVGGGEWGNVVAGGSGFTNLISWGRTNWP